MDAFNWLKKLEVTSHFLEEILEDYQGGRDRFFADFQSFFRDPRRFSYTPIILCKGKKPLSSGL